MASFYDVTDGRMTEFKRVLSQAGFTSDDVMRVIKTPDLAKRMYGAINMSPLEVAEWLIPPMSWSPPEWWRTPKQQLERANDLWPGVIPRIPSAQFVPRTNTEVPLLHVPKSFDGLCRMVTNLNGYTKWRPFKDKFDVDHLRLAPGVPDRTEPVWIGFDPEGHRYDDDLSRLWANSTASLAASEVLSAWIQFPRWPLSWGTGGAQPEDNPSVALPKLGGYQLKFQGEWSGVPILASVDSVRRMLMYGDWADAGMDYTSVPSVREL